MKLNNIVYYILILLVIGLVIYLVYDTQTEGFKCQSNPFHYAINHLTSSTNDEITCSCSFPRSNGVLLITKDNMSFESYSNMTLHL